MSPWKKFKDQVNNANLSPEEQDRVLKLSAPVIKMLEHFHVMKTNRELARRLDPSGQMLDLIEQEAVEQQDGFLVKGTELAAYMRQVGESIEHLADNLGGSEEEVQEALVRLFATFGLLCDFFGMGEVEDEPPQLS